MKILIAITKSNYGGAQRYVLDMATSLAKKYEVAVLFGGKGLLAEKLAEANVRTISISELDRDVNIFKDISVFFKVLKILKKEKPDVLMLNSSKIGGVGSFAGRLAGIKKRVFVCHGFAWNEDRGLVSKIFIKLLYSLIFLFSTKIIAVAQAIYNQGRTLAMAEKKMVVVYNGIEAAPLASRQEARQALGIAEKDFVVGTLAELHPVKGLSYATDAMSLLSIPDFEYVILGEGELRKNLEGKAILKGFVKDGQKYMRAFDIFLLPSISEAFAYVILEAGLAEIPVIATNVGGVPEIIKNDETGILIRAKNPKEIANAIRLLYENKEKALTLAKNLHRSVTTNFTLEKEIEETEKILMG